jgi:hypothetical protein
VKFVTGEGRERDVLRGRSGGGWLTLIGLPFLGVGIFVLGSALGLWALTDNPLPWFFGIPFGGIFAAVGSALALGRGGLRIDTRARTVTT